VVTALASAVDYFRRFNVFVNPRVSTYPVSQEDRKAG
jgi:hypothetical protein